MLVKLWIKSTAVLRCIQMILLIFSYYRIRIRISVLFIWCITLALDGNVDAVTFGTGTGGTIAGR